MGGATLGGRRRKRCRCSILFHRCSKSSLYISTPPINQSINHSVSKCLRAATACAESRVVGKYTYRWDYCSSSFHYCSQSERVKYIPLEIHLRPGGGLDKPD